MRKTRTHLCPKGIVSQYARVGLQITSLNLPWVSLSSSLPSLGSTLPQINCSSLRKWLKFRGQGFGRKILENPRFSAESGRKTGLGLW
jgi:hypothetical protein